MVTRDFGFAAKQALEKRSLSGKYSTMSVTLNALLRRSWPRHIWFRRTYQ